MDLCIKLGDKTYTAPPPKVKHFKEYLKLLRVTDTAKKLGSFEDIDMELAFIVSLFCSPDVTLERLEREGDFEDAARLHREYLAWLTQYIPDTGKNAKTR